ncbi:LLM class F420-dependent oxidoreductase [Sphaerisporangium sp. TRM90804]|uniref:LLM class F420-dependent oxidoreductase n=1 Tax=Sphaerisporangium sp. TRM90804 TaxID=3031113 RepID=UPI0024470B7A|nr:LLM class F420-dependent oxidoreductase [Sphaerisporangium sp. TRM90804]MDH2424243.1 LLM class F420-dependent oxidoreductase [Sphaerisporangium sp. TRM90804]
MTRPELGRIGVWQSWRTLTPELAAAVEGFGYSTLWVGGSPPADLEIVDKLLHATSTITVATGIVNIWTADPRAVATSFHRIESRHPGRFLLGIGAGHPEAVDRYAKPYSALMEYLDALDGAGVPFQRRLLAALGPKVLRLAAERSAGAHPYLTTPEHTRRAREILGSGPLLVPEQMAVLVDDPERARAIARGPLRPYLGLTNYTNNLRKFGFDDDDFAGEGSDRLLDALIAHGDRPTVRRRIEEHLAAGADQVAVQILSAPGADLHAEHEALAAALLT